MILILMHWMAHVQCHGAGTVLLTDLLTYWTNLMIEAKSWSGCFQPACQPPARFFSHLLMLKLKLLNLGPDQPTWLTETVTVAVAVAKTSKTKSEQWTGDENGAGTFWVSVSATWATCYLYLYRFWYWYCRYSNRNTDSESDWQYWILITDYWWWLHLRPSTAIAFQTRLPTPHLVV